MTNFEKWKEKLTVEQFVEIIDSYIEQEDCYVCPLWNFEVSHCMGCNAKCKVNLTEWANKRCDE